MNDFYFIFEDSEMMTVSDFLKLIVINYSGLKIQENRILVF